MTDSQLTLTAEEREYLVRLVENALKGDKVEMAHTDTRAYKAQIKSEIALVDGLLKKLKN